jgi:hypothetical protein
MLHRCWCPQVEQQQQRIVDLEAATRKAISASGSPLRVRPATAGSPLRGKAVLGCVAPLKLSADVGGSEIDRMRVAAEREELQRLRHMMAAVRAARASTCPHAFCAEVWRRAYRSSRRRATTLTRYGTLGALGATWLTDARCPHMRAAPYRAACRPGPPHRCLSAPPGQRGGSRTASARSRRCRGRDSLYH